MLVCESVKYKLRFLVKSDLTEKKISTCCKTNCQEWTNESEFRFTASNVGLIKERKWNHKTLEKTLFSLKPFSPS